MRLAPRLRNTSARAPISSPQASHRELARQDVAEAVEEREEGHVPGHPLQRPHQRRHEQAGHPAVQAIPDPRVVALREVEPQVRVDHRVAQAGDELAAVGGDVAVVAGDDLAAAVGQDVAVGDPAGAALAVLVHREPVLAQPRVERLQRGTVVPDEADALRQPGKRAPGHRQVRSRGAPEAHHHRVDVADVSEFLDDVPDRRARELGEQARQHESDRGTARVSLYLLLEQVEVSWIEPVQRCHRAGLVEVGHRFPR